MKKRIIGIALAVVLVVTSIFAYNWWNKDSVLVYASDFREGYSLEPINADATGVKVDSGFNFKWEEDASVVTVETLTEGLSISPELEVTISQGVDGLNIQPKTILEANTVYVFEYKGITWAYKTEAEFALIGTFPRNQITDVPVNTGIEFVFNYAGANVEDFFEIQPAVKGSFEEHGRVVVFVPKKLESKTIYTVTLKEGLTLKDTDKILASQTSFSFETENATGEDKEPSGYINFNSMINEFRTDEVPSIQWDFYMYSDKFDSKVETTIYAYKSPEKFMEDLNMFNFMPFWSYYGMEDFTMDTKDLTKVTSFDYELVDDGNYPQFLNLPDQLDQGYYLIDAVWEGKHFQTFIQVSDLSFYYSQNTNGDLFWIHDLAKGQPLEGVDVTRYYSVDPTITTDSDIMKNGTKVSETLIKDNESKTSDKEGIASFIGQRGTNSAETKLYLLQKGDMQTVLYSLSRNNWYGYGNNENNNYWKYFKSDRSLYQPDDQVEFFGYLKGRYEDIKIDEVSVEITRGGYYYFEYLPFATDNLSYVVEDVEVNNGFFNGKLTLPNLEQGGYELVVKHKGIKVASTYISVEEYVKPSYKMEVAKDKEAIFTGETMKYTVSSKFFEGTPVSYLDFNYNIGGIDYMEGNETTDIKGVKDIEFTPEYKGGYQDEQYYSFSAYADLPESGNIYINDSFRVFFNDIYVTASGRLEGRKGFVEIQADTITLDRLNDGTSEDSQDFIDKPVEALEVTGTIQRNEWVKTERGEYYDFINKVVKMEYDYNLVTSDFKDISLVTDATGKGLLEVDLPKEENVYYTADLHTKDSQSRNMNYTIYFGDYRAYEPNWGDYYHIELDKESYLVDDQVVATFKNGTDPYKDGQYLFTANQNGVIDYDIVAKAETSMIFSSEFVPNAEINGIYFNGSTYVEASPGFAIFDSTTKAIDLVITTDKEGYKPGEEVNLTIKATTLNEKGQRVSVPDALVNLSLIDEALLALSEQDLDPLNDLYRFVDGGRLQTYSSHRNQNGNFGGGMRYGLEATTEEAKAEVQSDGMDMNQSVAFTFSEELKDSESSIQVRSEFKDTAAFITITLGETGEGKYSFTLPDNVTSWRMTGAAISNQLQAGSKAEAVKVSLPFFVNTSISKTYLVGDKPMVGVSAYGSDLKDDEALNFKVEVYDSTGTTLISNEETTGTAYERVNLPLGELSVAGDYKVVVTAIRTDGSGDALELNINVTNTYHEQIVTDYYSLSQGLTLSTNTSGNTTLTFIDEGKGYYLPGLTQLAFSNGKRVDQKYLGKVVSEFLNKNFGMDYRLEDTNISDYLVGTGGIAILPYAEADLETTVNLLPLIKEEVSGETISLYLKNAWYDKNLVDKGAVLYGLAVLGEPVIYDLNSYAKIANLSAKDKLYVSLAYAEFGDNYMAKKVYLETVADKVEEFDTRAFVNLSTKEHENLELTAMAMLIADKVGLEIHDKYYDYVMHTYSKEVLVNTFKYNYMVSRLAQVSQVEGSLTYNYNGKEVQVVLDHGYGSSVTLPSATLDNFKITSVTGDLGVIASYQAPLVDSIKNDPNISVKRTYYNYQTNEEATTFKEGDLVKVVLEWEVKDNAIDDFYQLSDYAPAGLKPIDNPWQLGLRHEGGYSWYRDIDGQKVDFYVYKDVKEHNYEPLVYFARISSIGEYKSEAPIIQGTQIKDSMFIGEQGMIIIND